MPGGGSSPPPAPDPYKVASAEGKSNIYTALANQTLGNPNIVGPQGSTTYSPSGQFETITLPDGSTMQVQRQTQTTTLSPEQQQLYDLNTQTQRNIGQIGVDQSARIGDILGKPVDYSDLKLDPNSFSADRQRVEQAMFDRLNPQLDRSRQALETQLVNQGFQRGTQAFTDAMGDLGRQENDLRLGITAQGLGEQQGLYSMARDAAGYEMQRRTQQQNQPINSITALLSGSQASLPNVPGYNAPTVAGTNLGSNVYNSAALQNQQWQQQQQNSNSAMGGLFGLGSTAALGAMKYGPLFMSDRRLKRDMREIGAELESGVKFYEYKYVGDDEPQVGVMADEVIMVTPDAVHAVNGYWAVDYSKLGPIKLGGS